MRSFFIRLFIILMLAGQSTTMYGVNAAPRTHTLPGPSVSVGDGFSCVLATDGTVWCWGKNTDGQLGDGTTANKNVATQVLTLANIEHIHVGRAHACALQNTGKLFCWGDNAYGQLGDGTTGDASTPVEITSLGNNVTEIELGGDTSCAQLNTPAIKCWGKNTSTLGISPIPGAVVSSPTTTTAFPNFRLIEIGSHHACGVLLTGSARCWGENDAGQFGANGNGPNPVAAFAGLTDILSIATGAVNTCAIVSDGRVFCAGSDADGGLGNGDVDSDGNPVDLGMNQPWEVSGISDAVMVSLSNAAKSACVILASTSAVTCWGDNTYSQLGDGTTTDATAPATALTELSANIVRVAVGTTHACAIKDDGTVYCWGDNTYGQLGAGDSTTHTTIQTVSDGSAALDINASATTTIDATPTAMLTPSVAATAAPTDITNTTPTDGRLALSDNSSCALTALGVVWCWGKQYSAAGSVSVSTPAQRLGIFSVVDLAAGGNNTCALLANGRVFCWGIDENGESGCLSVCADGTNPGALIPDLYGITAIAVGPTHACGITTDAKAVCWGNNSNGQTGETGHSVTTVPYVVTTPNDVIAIAVSTLSTCAVMNTNEAVCWGSDANGELGDSTTTTAGGNTPVAVEDASGPVSTFVSIAATSNSFCAVDTSGQLWCWGDNATGQLGIGTLVDSNKAVSVTGMTGITSISGGIGTPGSSKKGSFCAVNTSRVIKCWGDAALGHSTVTTASTPVTVQSASLFTVTGRSDSHSCAVTTAYGISCWGANTYGQLGDASTTTRNTPVTAVGMLIGDTPTVTETPTATDTDVPTDTPDATDTNTPTASKTRTNTRTITPGGPTLTPTKTSTPTATFTASVTPGGPTLTASETPTETDIPTDTEEPTETNTYTPSRTRTKTSTRTSTSTPNPNFSATPTLTASKTLSPTFGPSMTPSKTYTASRTFTATVTPSSVPVVATELSIRTETRRAVLIETADARATIAAGSHDTNATLTREILDGSPSRTRTPTATRPSATTEPVTLTVVAATNRTATRAAIATGTAFGRMAITVTYQVGSTRTMVAQGTATALAQIRATQTAQSSIAQQTLTSLHATQTVMQDAFNATNEAIMGTGTRTRSRTATRTATATQTRTFTPTNTPSTTPTPSPTLSPTLSPTRSLTRTTTLTPTRVALLVNSVRTVVANSGHTLSANNASLYTITSGNRASGGTPQLIGVSTTTMAVQNTTNIPVEYLIAVGRNVSSPHLIAVVGRMNWNTLGVYIYSTQTGTPVLQHFFTKDGAADPTALLYTGRYLYIGSPKPNTTNYLAPYGTVEVINLETVTKPILSRYTQHLPAPPQRFVPIQTSEFQFVTCGDNANAAGGSFVIPVRWNGARFSAQTSFSTAIHFNDIALRSVFSGITRTHTIYAATDTGIVGFDMRESDLVITRIGTPLTKTMVLPMQKYTTIGVSPGGSYLYGGGVDPTGDYGMVLAFDLRTTPRYAGFYGEYGYLPSRMVITNTKLTLANSGTIVVTTQLSTLTGAP